MMEVVMAYAMEGERIPASEIDLRREIHFSHHLQLLLSTKVSSEMLLEPELVFGILANDSAITAVPEKLSPILMDQKQFERFIAQLNYAPFVSILLANGARPESRMRLAEFFNLRLKKLVALKVAELEDCREEIPEHLKLYHILHNRLFEILSGLYKNKKAPPVEVTDDFNKGLDDLAFALEHRSGYVDMLLFSNASVVERQYDPSSSVLFHELQELRRNEKREPSDLSSRLKTRYAGGSNNTGPQPLSDAPRVIENVDPLNVSVASSETAADGDDEAVPCSVKQAACQEFTPMSAPCAWYQSKAFKRGAATVGLLICAAVVSVAVIVATHAIATPWVIAAWLAAVKSGSVAGIGGTAGVGAVAVVGAAAAAAGSVAAVKNNTSATSTSWRNCLAGSGQGQKPDAGTPKGVSAGPIN